MMAVVVTAAAALALGYLLGRLRSWRRVGDWAADQVRFTGTWVRGGVEIGQEQADGIVAKLEAGAVAGA